MCKVTATYIRNGDKFMTKKDKRKMEEERKKREQELAIARKNKTKTIAGCSLISIALLVVVGILIYQSQPMSDFSKLDFEKYITVGDYTGIEYETETYTVTDEDIQNRIDYDVSLFDEEIEKDESLPAEEGDVAWIDYVGRIDGKEFEGGSATDYNVQLGSGELIPGFEDAIIGHKVTEQFTVDLVFPDDYENPDLAGKPVTFDVDLVGITQYESPEYTEEFVQENLNYDSKEEYEAAVKEQLQRQADLYMKNETNDAVWAKVMEKVELKDYPEDKLNEEFELIKSERALQYEREYDMTVEQMLENMNLTEDEYDEAMMGYAKENLYNKMVAYYIAKKENADISRGAYKKFLNSIWDEQGFSEEEFEQFYGMSFDEYVKENDMYSNFVYQQAVEKVKELGKEVDSTENKDSSAKDKEATEETKE